MTSTTAPTTSAVGDHGRQLPAGTVWEIDPGHADVASYPTATFRSTAVEWAGDHGVVHGDLTIHGVTRNVPLQVTFEGQVRDPWGGHRAMFAGRTTVNREDFGVTWNVALEAGGVLVSKEIQIEIDLETVRLDQ
jgi:polyisoprenoid-binding protein YceI